MKLPVSFLAARLAKASVRKTRNALGLIFACLLPFSPAFAAGEGAEKMINLDFSHGNPAMAAADQISKAQGRVTGQLPSGWEDNSSWAKVTVDYKLLVEEGRRYVAMNVSNVEKGHALLRHLIPDYGDQSFFKLTLKARSNSGAILKFGIRMAANPCTYAWSQKVQFESTWKNYDYFFTLDHNTQPMGFWLEMHDPGEVDIANVRLERVSREQLVEELKQGYSDGEPANVLRTSRLPLGLQSGWTESQYPKKAIESEIHPDSQEIGVSGFPALRIKSLEMLFIYSEPFDVPVPVQKYTASVFVKGTGRGKLHVMANSTSEVANKGFTASEEWQRVEVPFDPRLGEKVYALRLETSAADMLVDAWQVSPGEKAIPYQSQLPVEVSLACRAAETGEARVQFSDEAATAEYYVSGNPFVSKSEGKEAPRLHAKVVNLYGEEALIKPIALENKNVNIGKFDFNLFPNRPLGPFRIETWVTDAKGKRISAYQEMVIYRLHRPRYWGKDAPDSPFGTHVEADTLHIMMTKAVGNNWVRLHDNGLDWIGWNHLEPVQGQWTFYDDVLNRYRKQNLKIMGLLSTTPAWASYGNRPTHGTKNWDRYFYPKDLSQFGNYVRTVVERYKGMIDAYDVWNEPWNAAWFGKTYDETKTGRIGYKSGEHPQADYAALMKTAYEAAKAVYPGVTIVGINTTTTETNTKPYPDTGGADWSKGMKALNAEKDCDVLGYHQYDYTFNGFPGDAVKKGFNVAMGPFRDAGVKNPIWFTEGSCVPHLENSGFYHYTIPYVDPENTMDTGNRNCRFTLSLLANGSSKVFLYSMGSYRHFSAGSADMYASLISEDGYLHPTAAAFSHMAWELEDTKFLKIVPIGQKSFVYIFRGANKTVAVIAPAQQGDKITLPKRKDWTVTDQLGNPLTSAIHTGNMLVYIETAQPQPDFEKDLTKLAPHNP